MKQYTPQTIKPLIGKTIKSAILKDADVVIGFEDGTFVICQVEGDCCSSSAYYDIAFEGDWQAPLIEVIEHAYNNEDGVAIAQRIWHYDGDELRLWNVVFKTANGAVILKHINDSNGYYDGMTSYAINEGPLKSVLGGN